jgi:hypothetical protein
MRAPMEAAERPLPREDTTPPVMNRNLVFMNKLLPPPNPGAYMDFSEMYN